MSRSIRSLSALQSGIGGCNGCLVGYNGRISDSSSLGIRSSSCSSAVHIRICSCNCSGSGGGIGCCGVVAGGVGGDSCGVGSNSRLIRCYRCSRCSISGICSSCGLSSAGNQGVGSGVGCVGCGGGIRGRLLCGGQRSHLSLVVCDGRGIGDHVCIGSRSCGGKCSLIRGQRTVFCGKCARCASECAMRRIVCCQSGRLCRCRSCQLTGQTTND